MENKKVIPFFCPLFTYIRIVESKPKSNGTLMGFVSIKSKDDKVSSVEVSGGILDHLKDESWRKVLAG